MGYEFDIDNFKLNKDLDIASWDSYPLGFLEKCSVFADTEKVEFHRQGDPDFQALHHDLYRAVGKGNWWVMEQQLGPVIGHNGIRRRSKVWSDYGLGKQ